MKLLVTSIACAVSAAALAKTVSEPVTLTADTDWRGQGVVSFTDVGSVNLGGHNLWTDGISGGTDMLADATVPDPSKVFSSELYGGTQAKDLFDNMLFYSQASHRICANVFPVWFAYDFGTATQINGYTIYFSSCYYGTQDKKSYRSPKAWTFEGADNLDGSWEVLDRQESVTDWTTGQARTFVFANERKYRCYRLRVLSTNGENVLELYQLDFLAYTPSALVDKTEADASRVTSSSTFYSGDEKKLFDNDFRYDNPNHRTALYVSNNAPFEVTYDFGTSVCVNRYRVYYKSSSNKSDRAPGTWTLKGSDDKVTWTTVDSHVKDTNWKFPDIRTFICTQPAAYRYYRFEVTEPVAGNFFELYQLEYFTGPVVFSFTSDGFHVTDQTTNEPTRVSSSSLYGGLEAKNLFDDNFTYSFDRHRICANVFPAWFAYDFGRATKINGYAIYFDNCYFGQAGMEGKEFWRSPKAWTFEGADDPSGTWDVLDRRTQEENWEPKRSRSFSFANERKYRYYRLKVESTNGENVLELYQLEFGRAHGECQLHVDVGADVVQTNRSVVLAGQLDLVKEGAGTFVAALPQQPMAGEIKVEEGVLRAGASGEDGVLGAKGFANVSVASGATLDVDSFGGWMSNLISLNGGTLACSMPTALAPTATFGSIELTADSALSVRGPLTLGDGTGAGEIDLGGHRLAVDLVDGGTLNLALAEIRNGKVSFTVDGVQAASETKVASWVKAPSFVNTRLLKTKIEADGAYAYYPGFLLMFR